MKLQLPENIVVELARLTDDEHTAAPVTAFGILPPRSFLIVTGSFAKK